MKSVILLTTDQPFKNQSNNFSLKSLLKPDCDLCGVDSIIGSFYNIKGKFPYYFNVNQETNPYNVRFNASISALMYIMYVS